MFVFAVFLVSLLTEGYLYGVIAAFLGAAAVNYAFTFPYFALNFTIPVNLISGVIMIAIAILTSARGTLEPMDKSRGEGKALAAILNHLTGAGLCKGKVRIAHCMNESAALVLKQKLLERLEQVDVQIHSCRGLCSYYAEKGGLLVGFEKM